MGIEIERRFLVVDPPVLEPSGGTLIEQGYLAFGEGGSEVRVRRAGERHLLTVKRGLGLTRVETEIEITPVQFETLWPETVDRRLLKRRHTVTTALGSLELDVYGGALQGLIVAEVEFSSVEASQAYTPPVWCIREVTDDPRFRNRAVALLTPDALRRMLEEVFAGR